MNKFKLNIILSFIFTFFSTLSTFLLIKTLFIYFDYNTESYGLWMVIYSLLAYFYLMDFGISNGLRNLIAPYIGKDVKKVEEYLASNLFIMIVISITFLILSNIIILNIPIQIFDPIVATIDINSKDFKSVIYILINLQILYFLVSCFKPLFHSLSKSYLVNIAQFISNTIIIIFINLAVNYQFNNNWILISFVYIGVQIIVIITLTLYILKKHRITLKIKSNSHINKELLNIGISFFFLQLSNLILFNSIPFLTGILFTLTESLKFQLSYKILSIFMIIFSIIMAPIWTLLLEATNNRNFDLIRKTIKRLIILTVILSLCTIVFSLFQNQIIGIWMGKDFKYDILFNILMAIYMIGCILCSVLQSVMFGLNLFKMQLIGYILGIFTLLSGALYMYNTDNNNIQLFLVFSSISMFIPSILMMYSYYNYSKGIDNHV
ncbi:hypothetical protein [Macrococcoides caseolyticum]|uniref:hypothetical protein n=1 Tax=Macrococcoides caseolyticum TaxID=69966 RepID=UPI000C3438C2|nr:hypothetical protein [Macrococcus caseolyticus]PKE21927.1 hypothetical protein CW688_04815 [Macrococcus caseolyticus]PKE36701.1 hypothetical protein CW695_01850 [Macrococcus caseolyticus]PKE72565.1 hypothetical protein CW665_04700 [Macrococcus caseolyticus]PKE75676.1 hypothetical protein CW670_01885 [Macrococcus caseolyticus]PKF07314.1 hypothetical protein CW698_04555 [Macrococcus caseolyticus]